MRLIIAALGLSLLGGCGSTEVPDAPSITLEFPADQAEQSQPAADAQCKPLGKTAKYHGIEQHGETKVAVFACE
jgi:hypothetical protein